MREASMGISKKRDRARERRRGSEVVRGKTLNLKTNLVGKSLRIKDRCTAEENLEVGRGEKGRGTCLEK